VSDEIRPVEVPTWAVWARTAVRAVVVLYALSWLVRGVLELGNLVMDTSFTRGVPTVWSSAAFGTFLAVGAICGLAWLAGEVVAGYREPNTVARRERGDGWVSALFRLRR